MKKDFTEELQNIPRTLAEARNQTGYIALQVLLLEWQYDEFNPSGEVVEPHHCRSSKRYLDKQQIVISTTNIFYYASNGLMSSKLTCTGNINVFVVKLNNFSLFSPSPFNCLFFIFSTSKLP